jgi:hypothetical protein
MAEFFLKVVYQDRRLSEGMSIRMHLGPPLQNGETIPAHEKIRELIALHNRVTRMLRACDGGQAEAVPYSSEAFYASALSLLSDIKFNLFTLEILLEQVSNELKWADVDGKPAA